MLFSMSTMDKKKYQAVSDAVGSAFNVELSQQVKTLTKPIDYSQKNNSIIKFEFAKFVEEQLKHEIENGLLEIDIKENGLIIRFPEKVTFPSASAKLNTKFSPVLNKVGTVLLRTEGKIFVSGHTDNQPIQTSQYRSNWDLSASRAVSVIHRIINEVNIESSRFVVQGFADTKPMVKNNSHSNRAINRRVEIFMEKNNISEK